MRLKGTIKNLKQLYCSEMCDYYLTQMMLIYGQTNNIYYVTKLKTTYPLDQHLHYEDDILLPWSHYYL